VATRVRAYQLFEAQEGVYMHESAIDRCEEPQVLDEGRDCHGRHEQGTPWDWLLRRENKPGPAGLAGDALFYVCIRISDVIVC
jgi:hypothetical protein